jgi:hypothetical protein
LVKPIRCILCQGQKQLAMSKPILFGKVIDGQVFLEDLDLYHNLVNDLEGSSIQLSINEMSLSKTEKQKNTYFGIIIRKHMMESEAFGGWTILECDDYLGYKFRRDTKNVKSIKSSTSRLVEYIVPISKLNRRDMSEFMNQVIAYLTQELSIEIEIDGEKYTNKD